MDFELTDEQKEIKKAAREFAEGEFTDIAMECDREEKFPRDVWKKACKLGFIGAYLPEEYGGGGLGLLDSLIIAEEFFRVDPGVGMIMATTFGSEFIFLLGKEEQKQKYLPPLITGETICAAAFTEPDAGSDVQGIQTTAVKDGDEWVLNGTKMFITNGTIADWMIVLAKSHPDAKKDAQRFTTFIVDCKSPGFSAEKIHGKMGIRASDTAEIVLSDVRVPKENIVGLPKMGFYNVMQFFDVTRIGVGAQAVGLAQGALEMAVKHAKERKVFGRPLIYNQGIQFKLAEMATRVEAARNLVYKAAALVDAMKPDAAMTSMAKWYAGETAVYVADESLQVHGGYGYIDEYPIERFYRSAKVLEIYEGSKEIEKMIIGRTIGGKY